MSIDPRLLMILMQSAPALLNALQSQYQRPGSTFDGMTPMDSRADLLQEAILNRQYDPALLQANMDIGNTPDLAAMAVDRIAPEIAGNLMHANTPSSVSLNPDILNTKTLEDIYKEATQDPKAQMPAMASGASMLLADPNIGIPQQQPSDLPEDFLDEDMDEIHQGEMWDSGANYNNPLKNWYKKHKR